MTSPLLLLAEKVEGLSGPDREVDQDIYMMADVENGSFDTPYTASLDAALSLVPDGHEWLRKSPRSMTVYRVPTEDHEWAVHISAIAATPALALVAASLRARAAMEAGE